MRRGIPTLFGAVVVLAAAAALAAAQRPQFRSTVDIVSLNVTVVDGASHYVTDLDQPDFSIFEDGVKHDIVFFTRRP
ncbi:MAG TPA: hypothetical protein VHJ58_03405, partial [Vicinamibacterales bacterium]|nr:hypothetical protein [Vicinamibacterales bacterium]